MDQWLTDYQDPQVTTFLKFGWPINVDHTECPLSVAPVRNHKGARENPGHIIEYLHKEMSYKSVAGSFSSVAFTTGAVFSPLNTRDKKNSQEKRIIMDLSFPPDTGVNNFVNLDQYGDENMELKYPSLEALLVKVRALGPGCLLYKRDIRRCYRQIPVDFGDINVLGHSFEGHMFFDLTLPMGLASSAYICQRTTNSIRHIAYRFGVDAVNYLDDFVGAAIVVRAPVEFRNLGQVIKLCGAEENEVKACPPNENMDFVGITVDTIEMSVFVPLDKVLTTMALLSEWLSKAVATCKQLQSLVGTLNFLAVCIPYSRTFMARFIAQLRSMGRSDTFTISVEVHSDIQWWKVALAVFNGKSFSLLTHWTEPDSIIACDASLVGAGGYSEDEYFAAKFPPETLGRATHISALEMLTAVVSVKVFMHSITGKRIQITCDNEVTVQAINRGRVRDEFMSECLRELAFLAVKNDFDFRAVHISTHQNTIPDLLSRWYLPCEAKNQFLQLVNRPRRYIQVPKTTFFNDCEWQIIDK